MPRSLGQTPFTPDTITGMSSNSQLLCVSMGRVLTEPLLLPLSKGLGGGRWAQCILALGSPGLSVFLAASLSTIGEGRTHFLADCG